MKTTTNKITKLAKEYHELISGDHHKDRDCHWFIGHLQHWDKTNPSVVEDSRYFLTRCQEVLGPEETKRARIVQDQQGA